MASNELADKLARRCKLNDDKTGEKDLGPKSYRSIYAGKIIEKFFRIFFRFF